VVVDAGFSRQPLEAIVDYRLERLAGKSGVYYHQLHDGFASLWRGPNLGITVFVLTSLVALAYYLIVSRRP